MVLVESAYTSEADWEEEIAKRRQILALNDLTPPVLPYSREISQLLINFCKLSVQQYKTHRTNPGYKGRVEVLPAHNESIKPYTQLTSFQQEQDIIENYLNNFQKPKETSESNNTGGVTETIQTMIVELFVTFVDCSN